MTKLEDRVGKVCCKCKEFKNYNCYYKAKKRFDGHQTMCKSCDSVVSIKRHSENSQKSALGKIYRELPENKARAKKYHAELYQTNIEEMRARNLKWARENKDTVNRLCAKRRAAMKQATPLWATDEYEELLVQEIYHLAQLRRNMSTLDFHVDHIVPLTSKYVCGLHCAANLRVLEATENLKKHNRYWPDMWE